MTDMTYMKPVRLAEWSKALDSGSSLFVGVGSNPTADKSLNFFFLNTVSMQGIVKIGSTPDSTV